MLTKAWFTSLKYVGGVVGQLCQTHWTSTFWNQPSDSNSYLTLMTYLLKNIGPCGWLNSNPDQAVSKGSHSVQIIHPWHPNPQTGTGNVDPLIYAVHKLISATTLSQQRKRISLQSLPSVVLVEVTLSSNCTQKANLRSDPSGICDAFTALLVHVCLSCTFPALLSVWTWPVADLD